MASGHSSCVRIPDHGPLVLLIVTYIGFLAVQWSDRRGHRGQPTRGAEDDLAGMPVLQPIGVCTRNRSLPARVVVGLHDAREREVAEHRESALPKNDSRIVVPRGFRCNGASIPRPLRAILSPTGSLRIPGLIHDYAYRCGQFRKVENEKEASLYGEGEGQAFGDRLFRQTGREVNGMSFVNCAAWVAVYLFGCLSWRRHRDQHERPDPPAGMIIAGDEGPPEGQPADRPK